MDEEFKARLLSLDEEDQRIVQEIAMAAVNVLSTENGAMVVIADTRGDGTCMMLSCGNQFVVGPLLNAAQVVGGRFYAEECGSVQ